MKGKRFEDIVRILINVQLFLASVCVGSSPCMPESDHFGRYTVIGGGGNLWSVGVHSGSRVQVSVRCDAGAMAQQSVTSQCSNGTWIPPWPRCELDIRLSGGSGNYEGRVEVRVNGQWGTVCNETWDIEDATVVCRELGNRTAIKYDVMYGEGEGPILYTNSTCTGEEERLQDCPKEEPTVDACKHTQDAGVQCGFKDVDLRLVGGSTANEGRVEVYKKGVAGMGEWGRVCAGSEWDQREANVVCRTVGYPNGAEASSGSFGSGNGRVFIIDVTCTGTEFTFLGCKEANFGNLQACPTDEEDATVVCIPTLLEEPCLVPRNRGQVRQFVNGDATRPITSYYTNLTVPDGTQLVARCRDPGKYRLIGDKRRTCEGGRWTGEEPECQPVETQVLFYGAPRDVASNGTVVVYVHRENPNYLDVVCFITSLWLRPPRLTTPLVNDGDLWDWPKLYTDTKRLDPISTDFSGMYTCSGSSSFHSVHVLFKAAECEALAAPVHGRLLDGSRRQPRDIFPAGATVSFECEDDYSLVGSRSITCEKGQWSDDPPVCTAAECWAPAAPVHGRILDGSRQQARDIFPSGTSVSFECEDDYRLVGYWNITCEKGQWSDGPPVCTVSRCPVLNIPDHVVIEGVHFSDGRNIGDERIFNCVEGYVLQGDTNNLRCLESGVWSDPLPTCEESTEPPKNNGSCSNSCCTSSEYPCFIEDCYCDFECVSLYDCCDDYEDVCPTLERSIG